MHAAMAVHLAQEKDVERLRQAALLLEAENARLVRRNVELTRALLTAQGADASHLQLRLAEVERQLDNARAALFAPSSEKRPAPRPEDTHAPEAVRRGHGPRVQQALPLVEVVHVLDEADTQCPSCGGLLKPMTGCFEESEEVDVLVRRFVLKRHRRQKYRCACNACVQTAPGPQKLQPQGRYSLDFAVEVAASKYLDHLPLERQVRAMAREGLTCDSQTLWDQLAALVRLLLPTYDALWADQLLQGVLGADETRWPLLGSQGQAKWHLWTLASSTAVVVTDRGNGSQAGHPSCS